MKKFIFLALALGLSGCSAITVMRTKEIKSVETNLQKEIDQLTSVVDSLNQLQISQSRRIQADLRLILSALTDGNEKLAARIEENQYLLDRMSDTSSKGTSIQLSPALKVSEVGKQEPLIDESTENIGSSSIENSSSSSVIENADFNLELEKKYSQARSSFNDQKFKEAFLGFKGVYEESPTGSLAENALFWMATSYDQTNQGGKSIQVFNRLLVEFPEGKKVCSALFQIGRIYGTLEKQNEQRMSWQKLLDSKTCAGSNEAFRASELIGKIK